MYHIPLEVFEAKAIEAKKLLYIVYCELRELEDKGTSRIFSDEYQEIYNKSYHCEPYLRYFNLGNFKHCADIIQSGFHI